MYSQVVGILMVVSLFVGLFALIWNRLGIAQALWSFGVAFFVVGWICVAGLLIGA